MKNGRAMAMMARRLLAWNYLPMNQRTMERYRYDLRVEEGILQRPVLSMLLQPLLEYAVRHGARHMGKRQFVLTLEVTADRENDDTVLRLTDNGCGIPPEMIVQKSKTAPVNNLRPGGRRLGLWGTLVKYRAIYILLLPGVIWYLMFAVAPLFGLQLAFKTYRANLGIWGSPWAGTRNFDRMFRNPEFANAIRQTLLINVLRLLVTFTLPHFLSWVVESSIFNNLLASDGFVNNLIVALGGARIKIIGNSSVFLPLLYFTDIWRSAGWSMIVYLAAITDIDMEQYEAAEIDGASRWQMITHVTLPSISNTIVIMFILAAGNIMTVGLYYLSDRWNEWYHPMIFINSTKKTVLQLVLRNIVNETKQAEDFVYEGMKELPFTSGVKMACVVMTMLPVMCVYPFLQRYFLKGMRVGAVKG